VSAAPSKRPANTIVILRVSSHAARRVVAFSCTSKAANDARILHRLDLLDCRKVLCCRHVSEGDWRDFRICGSERALVSGKFLPATRSPDPYQVTLQAYYQVECDYTLDFADSVESQIWSDEPSKRVFTRRRMSNRIVLHHPEESDDEGFALLLAPTPSCIPPLVRRFGNRSRSDVLGFGNIVMPIERVPPLPVALRSSSAARFRGEVLEAASRSVAAFSSSSTAIVVGKYNTRARGAKTKAIEDFDKALPILLEKKPDVIAITGDHSTPCALKGHSWHPQPVLLHSNASGSDKLDRFTETNCNRGSLGIIEAKHLIRLMQANALMFDKFGA